MQRFFILLGLALAFASPTFADAIDGEWCSSKGLRLKITGPDIVIPSGAAIKGRYGRHHFAYVVPAGEAEAGAAILMQLLNEEEMNVYTSRSGDAGAPELWRRCEVIS
jgi:hypothetical protein